MERDSKIAPRLVIDKPDYDTGRDARRARGVIHKRSAVRVVRVIRG